MHGAGTRGDDVKRPIIHSALLVAVVSLFPTSAGAQQRPAVNPAAASSPNTIRQTVVVRHSPEMMKEPGIVIPWAGSPGLGPLHFAPEWSERTAAARKEDGDAVEVKGDEAFLLPVWHFGFWAMPPGGLTRFLISPPTPVDIEDRLAPDPATDIAGRAF